MKLYYMPGACSLSPHIVAREAGLDLELDRLDHASMRTASGEDYRALNPKGYVPALRLDDGDLLTEGPVIVQYLADQAPAAGLIPAAGTRARYHVQEMLSYITSELHKTYSPLFNPASPPELRAERIAYLQRRYAPLEERLAAQPYLHGAQFQVSDAYLFVVTHWARALRLELLSALPALQAFQQRVAQRPAVQAAMRAEGLIK
ncbi:glutathione transferase GstA [Thermomonas flagellata]|uniref:glutathione transferase GstA n=1 Tax=Thermomonas flagellata TaxID=2888524 RepID=UPI001F038662|nr:glutathione transferase GstA [Thermomonas flagellata]